MKAIWKMLSTVLIVLAMTGIGSADQMKILNGGVEVTDISLPVSGSVSLDLQIRDLLKPAGTPHEISVNVYDTDMNPIIGASLKIEITELEAPLGSKPSGIYPTDPNPIVLWQQTNLKGGTDKFSLKISDNAAVPKSYIVKIEDFKTGASTSLSAATLGADVKVPEFSTVAIPVAGVIGLLFVFQARKNKKE